MKKKQEDEGDEDRKDENEKDQDKREEQVLVTMSSNKEEGFQDIGEKEDNEDKESLKVFVVKVAGLQVRMKDIERKLEINNYYGKMKRMEMALGNIFVNEGIMQNVTMRMMFGRSKIKKVEESVRKI